MVGLRVYGVCYSIQDRFMVLGKGYCGFRYTTVPLKPHAGLLPQYPFSYLIPYSSGGDVWKGGAAYAMQVEENLSGDSQRLIPILWEY